MSAIMRARTVALVVIAGLVLAASAVSFAESFRGLYLWASEHGLSGRWALVWPLQIDVFIAVGEAALLVALIDGWAFRSRLAAWAVTVLGLAASVAGNIGHVASHELTFRLTAAVPPLAAAAALAVGLGVLKRVVALRVPAPDTAALAAGNGLPAHLIEAQRKFTPGEVPTIRRIRAELGIGQDKAQQVQTHLAALTQ